MSTLRVENFRQADPAPKNGVKILSTHKDHGGRTDARVSLHRGLGEVADRDEQAERRLELVLDLAVEVVQVGRLDRLLLPLRLEQVVGVLKAESPVDLLPLERKGGLRIEVEERE